MRQLKSPYGCRECGRTLEYVFDGHPGTAHGVELVFACVAHPQQAAVYVSARYWQDERPGRGEPEDYRLAASLIHQMQARRHDPSGHASLSRPLDDGIIPVLEAFR